MFGGNNNNERKKQQQALKQQQTAYQAKLTRDLFRGVIKWKEKYIEIAYPDDFPNWQERKQIHADEIKRTDIVGNPKMVEKCLSTALLGFDGDTDNSELLSELKTNFYEWIDAVSIDPSNCPERLKHFLVGFHEMLERGRCEKINDDAVNRIFEVDPSSQEFAERFVNSFISIQGTLHNERKVEKSLEGKKWREMENKNKFAGNAERGKWIFDQITRNHDYKDFHFWPQKNQQVRNSKYNPLLDDPSEEFLSSEQNDMEGIESSSSTANYQQKYSKSDLTKVGNADKSNKDNKVGTIATISIFSALVIGGIVLVARKLNKKIKK